MKRRPQLPAMQESARRQIDELTAALERSTKALIAGDSAETTPERDRWTRLVMKRIQLLANLAPTEHAFAGAPSVTARSQPVSSASPAPTEDSPPSVDQSDASAPSPKPATRYEKRRAAKEAKERRTKLDRLIESSDRAIAGMERMRAAFPDMDPFQELQNLKDRNFSSA